jgi:sugar phosphate isomerase/epimerase
MPDNVISFMTANFVARPLGYNMTDGWMQGDKANQAHFRPAKTFAERFEAYLADIKAAGFMALDLWLGVLHPSWATDAHLDAAGDLLDQYGLTVASLAGGFGDTLDEFEAACELAAALDAPILGGGTPLLAKDRAGMVEMLRKYGLRFGYENHPEKTPEELLRKVGRGDEDVIGLCVDTGWFGTNAYPAIDALEKLHGRLFHLHLKDVRAAGGHETCRFGEGVVGIEACVATLKRVGYAGGISIEHEPEHADPMTDVIASYELLRGWLAR